MSATAMYKALIEAKVPETSAEKAVDGLLFFGEAATKNDIAEVRTEMAEMKTEMAEMKTELKTDINELKNDIAEVRTEMAEMKTELKTDMAKLKVEIIRWNLIIAGTIIAILGLLIKL